MIEFTYNNANNASTYHTLFELNCEFYSKVSFEEDDDSQSRFRFAKKLVDKQRELMKICYQNILHIQKS